MNDLVERKKKRLQFLNKMYEVTRGNANCVVMERELGRELGFTDEETDTTVQYLEGEGLVTGTGAVTIGITHHGVLEVEAALEHPDQPTKYFPPVNITLVSGKSM